MMVLKVWKQNESGWCNEHFTSVDLLEIKAPVKCLLLKLSNTTLMTIMQP
jgi:hypothetical protein